MRENHSRRPTHSWPSQPKDEAGSNGFAPGQYQDALAVPEAELLRVIERALQAQRLPELEQPAPQDTTAPLVSRIETILGKRLEAANDAATAPNPPIDDAAPSTAAVMDEAAMDDLIDDLAAQEFHVESITHAAVEHQAPASPRSGRSLIAAGALCALGALGGTLIPSEPSGFRAQSLLGVEGPAKDHQAVVSATHDALISQKTIAMAVAKLQLDRDAEFAGASGSAFNVAVDLLSASGAAADPVSRAEASLAAAIRASADPKSGTIGFSVTTASAAKSARIASYLVSTVAHPVSAASANDGAVKKASAVADADLEAFTKQNGEGNVEVATRLQQQLVQANESLKDAQQKVVAAKTRADLLKTATADDALTGALAADITSPALDDRRGRYAVAKSTLAQLAASLGPRHPRLIAQQAEVDGLRASIGQELGRLSRDAADEVKSTVAAVRQLGDQRNTLIAQSRDTGVDLAKLTELREKSAVARQRLEDELSTGAIGTDGTHVQVIKAPVVTAIEPGRSPWLAPALGALAGLAFGLAGFRRRVDVGNAVAHVEPVAEIEPSVDIPLASVPEPVIEDATDEVELLRAEIAAMRDRLRSYAATA
ncbi:succinoglycan biosynthesis protein [Rhizobium sp. 16-449-1b]|uniref:succinoglycan biosynthesis protein n=1 Tax=Rhizobium sp. 16-449-1b TaxID=2819989 RepID=UPI001ADCA5A4|nr:succinoglycan biosynthesis protein [Rhizobium sp. 16-449-1b]MBO9193083.1 succinoglycan biosynthesis protein [Rhizobium sp. 16-449-1b]